MLLTRVNIQGKNLNLCDLHKNEKIDLQYIVNSTCLLLYCEQYILLFFE
jgi:hypothetical protein